MEDDGEHFAKLQIVCHVEMHPLVRTLRGPAERRFQRERVYQIELTPHDNSRTSLSAFLDSKRAIVEREILVSVEENARENALLQAV